MSSLQGLPDVPQSHQPSQVGIVKTSLPRRGPTARRKPAMKLALINDTIDRSLRGEKTVIRKRSVPCLFQMAKLR